jgi:hypothetical protein
LICCNGRLIVISACIKICAVLAYVRVGFTVRWLRRAWLRLLHWLGRLDYFIKLIDLWLDQLKELRHLDRIIVSDTRGSGTNNSAIIDLDKHLHGSYYS